jgi:hypothetical protein
LRKTELLNGNEPASYAEALWETEF